MKTKRMVKVVLALVLVAGASGLLLRAQNPQNVGEWVSAGPVAETRSGAASAVLADGTTIVLGGRDADGNPTAAVTVYDPVTNGVATIGQLSAARVGHSASLLADGRIAVIGGSINDVTTADIEIFNPATGNASFGGQLPQARTRHAAATLKDGRVLVVGGNSPNADGTGLDVLASAELYDPTTGSTSPVPGSLNTARAGASATLLIDGTVLIAGGYDAGQNDLASAEIFHPDSAGAFSTVPTSLSQPRSGHTAILLPNNNGVLIAGGTTAGVAVDTVDLFLPAIFPDPYSYGVGTMAPTGSLTAPRARAFGGPKGDDGLAYVAGGGVAGSDVYRFATIKTDKDDYAPDEKAVITGSGWQPGQNVTLLFQEDPAVHPDYTLTVAADANGNIDLRSWAPDKHDLGVRFYLTAFDSQSRAQVTFTDNSNVNLVTPAEGSGVAYKTTAGGIDVTISGTYTCTTSGSACYGAQVGVTIKTDDGSNGGFGGTAIVTDYRTGNLSTASPAANWSVTIPFRTVPGVGQFPIPADGLYEIQATLWKLDTVSDTTYNTNGGTSLNDAAFAIDNTAPTVNLSSPANNSYAQCTGNTTLVATASDAVGLAKVEFYVNGVLKGTDTSAGGGWSVNLTSADFSAANTWYAIAYDSAGNQTQSPETWNIALDCTKPTVTVNQAAGQADPTSASPIHFTVTFSEDISGFDNTDVNLTASTAVGPFTVVVTPDAGNPARIFDVAVSGMTTSGTVIASVNPNRADDAAGNGNLASTSTDNTVTYNTAPANTAPTVAFTTAPTTANEGETKTYNFSITDPNAGQTFSFVTGFPDCGTGGSLVGGSASIDSTAKAGTFQCSFPDGNASPIVRVQVQDSYSTPAASNTDTVSVTVSNVEPTIAISGNTNVNEGSSYSLTLGAITDPGQDTVTSWIVHWGDGNSDTYNSGGVKTHTYADGPNDYSITVDLTDEDGTFLDQANAKSVHVDNVAPTVAFTSGPTVVNENGTTEHTYQYSISDPGDDTITSVSTSCGTGGTKVSGSDSNTNTSGSFKCIFPDGPATPQVTAAATDSDGATSTTATRNVTVDNVEPTIAISGNASVNEGSSYSLTLGTITDPGQDTVTSWVVHWGDGNSDTYNSGGIKTHTYVDGPNNFNITVDLTDEDGTFLDQANALAVTVNNVKPTLSTITATGNTGTACTAGNTVSLSFSFTDPAGTYDTYTGSINWGDGSSNTSFSSSPVSTSHNYAPGAYTITITVNDEDPGTGDSKTVAVSLLYQTSGILQPINADGSSNFKLGSTIPVKVRITDCTGASVTTLSPLVSLYFVSGASGPVNEVVSSSAADSGNHMRYDPTGAQYIFNLSTKRSQFNAGQDLIEGRYRLTISDPTIADVVVYFDIRK